MKTETGIIQNLKQQLKIANEKLAIANNKLRRADELKTEFLNNITHELRTPVSGILAVLSILDEKSTTKDYQRNIPLIAKNAKNLLSIINSLLDISKIDAKKMKLRKTKVPLELIVKDSKILIDNLNQEQKELDFSLSFTPKDQFIQLDYGKTLQIVSHLISNAIKFTDSGKIIIDFSVVDDNLQIMVKDTGIGIAKEDLACIFEPFIQLDCGYTRKYKGAGLGLTIVKKIVEMMNGDIWVASEKEVGSSFTITIPLTNKVK